MRHADVAVGVAQRSPTARRAAVRHLNAQALNGADNRTLNACRVCCLLIECYNNSNILC